MRRALVAFSIIAFLGSSCSGGARTRTIEVDFSYDQFNSFFAHQFPDHVTVAAGDKLVFRQTWTGEPHTVTGGRFADKILNEGVHWLPFFNAYDGLRATGVDLPDSEGPPVPKSVTVADIIATVERSKPSNLRSQFLTSYDKLASLHTVIPLRKDAAKKPFQTLVDEINGGVIDKLFNSLPFAHGEGPGGVAQNMGQPCFTRNGNVPKDPGKPCSKAQQKQPAFDGRANVYNSGIIPYEGTQGNTYEVPIAANAKPGTYYFYCAVHGPGQSTTVTIRPKGTNIPSQSTLNREAASEVRDLAAPLVKVFRDAQKGSVSVNGMNLKGPFAGVGSPAVEASVNEFIPKTITTKVNNPVTWTFLGSDHSVSFSVPKYFPIMRFAKDGTVSFNKTLYKPVGSPKVPEGKEGEPTKVDGGTYNGRGFFSSSVFGGDPYATYTLRVSRPGTYKYACLIHPAMVGTLVVRP